MAYDNVISRSDAAALMPEEVGALVTSNVQTQSAAMALFRKVPMSRAQQRIPVLSALPVGYFVNGDTGLKQTTEVAWANKYLDAEEVAVIVPIPEAVLDDTSFDVWGMVRPLIEEALARTVDAAVFFGTNKPSSWPDDIVTAATAASNTATRGTNTAAQGGLAEDISDLLSTIEADGFDATGAVANRTYKGYLRGARDANGNRLAEVTQNDAWGVPIAYPMRGMWPSGSGAAELIAGDGSQGIFGIRSDLTYKVLDQAVITDNTGTIVYNLAQQDMVALRTVARYAWQVPNPINRDQSTEANRYPFAILLAP